MTLPEHLSQVTFIDFQPHSLKNLGMKCRRFFLTYRRQLSTITHQQHTAILPIIDELHQIGEQIARSEVARHSPTSAYHRSLINHKERVFVHVVVQIKLSPNARIAFLTIDFTVNGEGSVPTIHGKNLGSTTCGRH